MAEKTKPATPVEETDTPEKTDLQKSLDENLETMDKLIKSGSDEAIDELLKSKDSRKKIKEKLDEYEKGEKDEEDDDEEDEEGEDDEDDEEEPKAKGKKGMKKSLDEATVANEEVIDAVPVLKSFVDVLGSFATRLDEVSKNVSELRKSQGESSEVQKSFGAVLKSTGDLIKSMNTEIERIGSQPLPVKGRTAAKGELLEKSFGGEGEDKSYPMNVVRDTLLKSVQEGTISANSVAKWELARYNINAIPEKDRAVLLHKLEGGK